MLERHFGVWKDVLAVLYEQTKGRVLSLIVLTWQPYTLQGGPRKSQPQNSEIPSVVEFPVGQFPCSQHVFSSSPGHSCFRSLYGFSLHFHKSGRWTAHVVTMLSLIRFFEDVGATPYLQMFVCQVHWPALISHSAPNIHSPNKSGRIHSLTRNGCIRVNPCQSKVFLISNAHLLVHNRDSFYMKFQGLRISGLLP